MMLAAVGVIDLIDLSESARRSRRVCKHQDMRRFMWESGGAIDPTDYKQWLALHGDELPPGARSYASHPSQFDFYAFRVGDEPLDPETPLCPKDLLLHRVTWSGEQDSVELNLIVACSDLTGIWR